MAKRRVPSLLKVAKGLRDFGNYAPDIRLPPPREALDLPPSAERMPTSLAWQLLLGGGGEIPRGAQEAIAQAIEEPGPISDIPGQRMLPFNKGPFDRSRKTIPLSSRILSNKRPRLSLEALLQAAVAKGAKDKETGRPWPGATALSKEIEGTALLNPRLAGLDPNIPLAPGGRGQMRFPFAAISESLQGSSPGQNPTLEEKMDTFAAIERLMKKKKTDYNFQKQFAKDFLQVFNPHQGADFNNRDIENPGVEITEGNKNLNELETPVVPQLGGAPNLSRSHPLLFDLTNFKQKDRESYQQAFKTARALGKNPHIDETVQALRMKARATEIAHQMVQKGEGGAAVGLLMRASATINAGLSARSPEERTRLLDTAMTLMHQANQYPAPNAPEVFGKGEDPRFRERAGPFDDIPDPTDPRPFPGYENLTEGEIRRIQKSKRNVARRASDQADPDLLWSILGKKPRRPKPGKKAVDLGMREAAESSTMPEVPQILAQRVRSLLKEFPGLAEKVTRKSISAKTGAVLPPVLLRRLRDALKII